eukprot:13689971-Ditylum_brightwellii.AAC.1
MEEWRKRFAMLPEEVVKQTLESSTNFYFNVEVENRQDLRTSSDRWEVYPMKTQSHNGSALQDYS